jgi:predicted RNase H-like nuclease
VYVVGVDGCPAGWIAVRYDLASGQIEPALRPDARHVLAAYPDAVCIGIDIPIGLSDGPPRACDIAARRLLGRPRASSVFPAPPRPLLRARTFADASARSRELFGRGVSIQSYAIYRRVDEVDQVMTPDLQQRVVEVHPEVSFAALAGGQAMRHAKKTAAGYVERCALLAAAFDAPIPFDRAAARRGAPFARPDDLLDAIAVAWTARRVAEGQAGRLPDDPPRDARGLRMEIVY